MLLFWLVGVPNFILLLLFFIMSDKYNSINLIWFRLKLRAIDLVAPVTPTLQHSANWLSHLTPISCRQPQLNLQIPSDFVHNYEV